MQTSNFDFVDTYRRDKNLDNGPLRIYGELYAIGLALHAHTELEYDLKGDYREFHAIAGIDQSVGGVGGPVVLVIEGVIDGETKELYKKTFTRKDAKDKKDGIIESDHQGRAETSDHRPHRRSVRQRQAPGSGQRQGAEVVDRFV